MIDHQTGIMTVLPPKEGYAPHQVGAIGLLVQSLAQPGDWIVGQKLRSEPFNNGYYLGIDLDKIGWFSFFNSNKAYLNDIIRKVQHYSPKLIEIHNRPEIALALAKRFPQLSISLTLHNDPLGMRGLKTVTERQNLIQKVHIIAVSEWVKTRFLEHHIQGNVTILPNCIDLKKIPSYIPVKERQKTILFVGRIVADKGADLFVRICQGLLEQDPTWEIILIGADRFSKDSPETDFIRQLRQQIKGSNIKMIGYLSHETVMKYMSSATLIMMPSRWEEPFGMTALEAMACGTPLLVSSRGALPTVVGNGALVIDPDNIKKSIIILKQLLINQELQESLSQKALQQVLQYNSENALNRLNQFRKHICPQLFIE